MLPWCPLATRFCSIRFSIKSRATTLLAFAASGPVNLRGGQTAAAAAAAQTSVALCTGKARSEVPALRGRQGVEVKMRQE